jgi:glutathione S-transferase
MAELSIREAMAASGLRLMTIAGVPSPWSEAVKGILHVKGLEYRSFDQTGEDGGALQEWTRQDSKPVLVWNDERPATGWAEILHLAERLQRSPRLIPEDPVDRTLMFGFSHELCGEMGLGWAYRVLMVEVGHGNENDSPVGFPNAVVEMLAHKYGWSEGMAAVAKPRVIEILDDLDRQLARQQELGRQFLIGERLSAVDIYWAAFCAILNPLPDDQCPMIDFIRTAYTCRDEEIIESLSERLLQHRDDIYTNHLELPVSW